MPRNAPDSGAGTLTLRWHAEGPVRHNYGLVPQGSRSPLGRRHGKRRRADCGGGVGSVAAVAAVAEVVAASGIGCDEVLGGCH